MILFNAWGLLGLLAIPGILAIHLFRRRFRPRPVTGLFLYGPDVRTVAAGRTRQRLLWRTSLALELLAALALTWYFTDPHLDERQQSRHLVVVLDSRWRVAAATSAGSVDAALRTLVGQRIAALSPDDRVTLIASGTTPVVFCGPAARPGQALEHLATWRPQQPWHELDGALTLGRSLADRGAQLVVASDRTPEPLPPMTGVLAAGQALATSGIADARWYDDAEGRRVVVRLLAQGGDAQRRLDLRAGETILGSQSVRLVDGIATTAVFPLMTPINGPLVLVLSGTDPLPIDDRVALVPPPPAVVLVRVTGDAKDAFNTQVRRAFASVPGVRVVDDQVSAVHLQVGDGLPATGTWALQVAPGTAKPVLGPFLARRGHAVIRGIDFTGVLWNGGADTLGAGDTLVEAGGSILISEQRRDRDRTFILHIDPATSGLTNHPAWPALIANLVAARRAALPGVRQPNVLPGQDLLVTLPPGRRGLRVIDPQQHEARLLGDGDGVVLIPGLTNPGGYRLRLDDEAGDWAMVNVLPCDARLGDLRQAGTANRTTDEQGQSQVERHRPMLAHLLPIVCAALLALAGWSAFMREEVRAP